MTDAASLVASLLLDALAPSRPAPPVAPAYCSFETRESLVPLELTSLWCLISSPIPTPLPSPELLLKSPTTSSTQTASRSTTVAGSISSVGTGEGAGRRSSSRRSQTCRARREQWRSTRSVRFPRPSTGISYPWCGFWSSGSSLGTWLCARSITRSVIETTISAARRTGMRPTRTPVPTTLLASLLSGRRLWKECRAVVGKYLKSSARCRVSSSRFSRPAYSRRFCRGWKPPRRRYASWAGRRSGTTTTHTRTIFLSPPSSTDYGHSLDSKSSSSSG